MSELWCIRIPGPDDIWAMASKEEAEQAAETHNVAIKKWLETECKLEFPPTLESITALVETWPYDAESHAEDLLNERD